MLVAVLFLCAIGNGVLAWRSLQERPIRRAQCQFAERDAICVRRWRPGFGGYMSQICFLAASFSPPAGNRHTLFTSCTKSLGFPDGQAQTPLVSLVRVQLQGETGDSRGQDCLQLAVASEGDSLRLCGICGKQLHHINRPPLQSLARHLRRHIFGHP